MPVHELDKPISARDLVALLDAPASILGDETREITVLGPLSDAALPGILCFCNAAPDALAEKIAPIQDGTVVAAEGLSSTDIAGSGRTVISVADPRRYFLKVIRHYCGEERTVDPGIHPTAVISKTAQIGANPSIGPNVFIDEGVIIGSNCRIQGNVQIYAGTEIGENVLIQANAVVGCIGQSYERDESGSFLKMPHLSGVVIGNDVQIGVGSSIVRGTLQDTVIGSGTVIGNQSNVGHNVRIGTHCHIGAGTIVCGSSVLGDEVWLSIGSIVRSVPVGDGSMVGIAAVVNRPVEANMMANGFPARVTPKVNTYNQRSGR